MSGEFGLLSCDRSCEVFSARYGHLDAPALLTVMIRDLFPGRIALCSSFGTESAVLLSLVAKVAPDIPVIFLDPGLLFAQTNDYRRSLQTHLGLKDVRVIRPSPCQVEAADPFGRLHTEDHDACCALRKVAPLNEALAPFDVWITGRKRAHGQDREELPLCEYDGTHLKVNPLAHWTFEDVQAVYESEGLPRHPLEAMGYTSVGCYPCTALPDPQVGGRSGRWAGGEKTECGIHRAPASVSISTR